MNPDATPKGSPPEISINPEDDVELQAIEAHEEQVVDPNPQPLRPREPAAKPLTPTPAAKPVVVVAPPPVVKLVPKHLAKPVDLTPVVKPIPAAPIPVIAPKPAPIPTPAPVPVIQDEPVTPKVRRTLAAAMADEIARFPALKIAFQPFIGQNGFRKPPLIAIVIIVLALMSVGGFIAWRSLT